jgi:hypothetical protein
MVDVELNAVLSHVPHHVRRSQADHVDAIAQLRAVHYRRESRRSVGARTRLRIRRRRDVAIPHDAFQMLAVDVDPETLDPDVVIRGERDRKRLAPHPSCGWWLRRSDLRTDVIVDGDTDAPGGDRVPVPPAARCHDILASDDIAT